MPQKFPHLSLLLSLIFLFIVYAVHIGVNDVWYPNESLYADSLRNWMNGRGNWFEFWYNDDRRFNKPPGTYFYIYVSALIFGLNEFALRISMPLLAVGSVFYTFKLGDYLYGSKVGWLSGAIMAVSIQFVANIRYATPEVPLCFAFAATMYYFIKAIRTHKSSTIWLAWIFLGITVWTKGFPYYIVIGGTVVLYLLWSKKNIRDGIQALVDIKIWTGGLVALILGMSWPVYSLFVKKDSFLHMYGSETLGRASDFGEYSYSLLTQVKFYPEAMIWAFLPYSVAMYIALFILIKKRDFNDGIKYILAWVGVMYIIFTISSGKIPTYFIQAHPALSVLTAYAILSWKDIFNNIIIRSFSFYLPTILGIALTWISLYLYQAPFYLYLISPLFLIIILYINKDNFSKMYYAPFASIISFIFVIFYFILPQMEAFRPFDRIGEAVRSKNIPIEVPIYMHKHWTHNMSYYTGRKYYKKLEDRDVAITMEECLPAILMVRDSIIPLLPPGDVIWEGPLFYDLTEAKFLKFFLSNQKAMNGNMEDYIDYSIIYFDSEK